MSTAIAPANGNGNQVAKQQPKTIQQWLKDPGMLQQFAQSLPKHMTPERFARVALTAMTRTPKLSECTTASLMRCLLDCSAMGLEPDGRRAHLIPYKDQCTLIIDYKGMVELVRRSGDVVKLHSDVVCENDEFECNLGEITKHAINYRKPRGDVYAVYAVATLKDGSTQCAVMTRDEVESIRKRSRAGTSGPWVTDWNEMAKKTAFRRLCKWLTLSPEIRDAFETDDSHSGIVETTATRIDHTSGNDRLAALLTEPKTEAGDEPDGGPTPEDVAGNVNHDATEKTGGGETIAEAMQRIQTLLDEAKTAADVDGIVHSEIASGDYTGPQAEQIDALGATRKRIIAGAKVK